MSDKSAVVTTTLGCEVVLDSHGFYARATTGNDPYVSRYTPAKFVAVRWANAHDEGRYEEDGGER